jgi:hypothetical protein
LPAEVVLLVAAHGVRPGLVFGLLTKRLLYPKYSGTSYGNSPRNAAVYICQSFLGVHGALPAALHVLKPGKVVIGPYMTVKISPALKAVVLLTIRAEAEVLQPTM